MGRGLLRDLKARHGPNYGMNTYVAFLRGINVGGNNKVPMADLRQVLSDAGFGGVKTYLQSGNVRLSSDDDVDSVKSKLEAAISDGFGFKAHVLVRTLDQVQSVVDGYVFDEDDDNFNHNAVLVEPQAHHDLAAFVAMELVSDEESAHAADGAIYWKVPKGASTSTDFSKELARAKHRAISTTRTIRTLRRML